NPSSNEPPIPNPTQRPSAWSGTSVSCLTYATTSSRSSTTSSGIGFWRARGPGKGAGAGPDAALSGGAPVGSVIGAPRSGSDCRRSYPRKQASTLPDLRGGGHELLGRRGRRKRVDHLHRLAPERLGGGLGVVAVVDEREFQVELACVVV